MRFVLALLLTLVAAGPALAVNPDEVLADPALEARARELSKGLRCVVCQNQSIDDSDAELARDLRVLVRERLTKGDNDQEVVAYLVSRYGDYVLMEPPFKVSTLVLWLGPLAFGVIGVVALAFFYRRRTTAGGTETVPAGLSDDEKKRLDALLKDGDS